MLKLSRFSPGLCLGCLFSQILLIIGSGKVAGVRWLQWPVAVQGSGPRSSSQPPADTQGRTFVPGWGPHLITSSHPHTSHLNTLDMRPLVSTDTPPPASAWAAGTSVTSAPAAGCHESGSRCRALARSAVTLYICCHGNPAATE